MELQYPPSQFERVPLKDFNYKPRKQERPDLVTQLSPVPPGGELDYIHLPPDWKMVRSTLGTNLNRHIYEARKVDDPRFPGMTVRKPSAMTTLVPSPGLYDPNLHEKQNSFLDNSSNSIQVKGIHRRDSDGPYTNTRAMNLTGPKPQVRVFETPTYGPFYSPNPERGLYTWRDMGI